MVSLWAIVVGLLPLGSAWLRVGGAGHSLAGYEAVASLPLHRTVASVAVACAAAVALSARPVALWTRRHQVAAAAAGLAVVGVLVGSGWFSGGTYDLRPDADARADACSAVGPTVVCAMPEHALAAEAAVPALTSVVEARRALGVPTPQGVAELTPYDLETSGGRRGRGGESLGFTIDPFSPSRNADAAASLVLPATCFAAQDGLTPGVRMTKGCRILRRSIVISCGDATTPCNPAR